MTCGSNFHLPLRQQPWKGSRQFGSPLLLSSSSSLSQSVKESFLEPLSNLSLPLSTLSQLPASLGSVDWLTMQIYILFEYVVTFSIKIYEDFANLCHFLTLVNGK